MEDYVQVPAGEPLRAHISRLETTQDTAFESSELVTKLVVRFSLDEQIEGQGQVYSAWLNPSLNPKSKMFKMLSALYGGNIPNPVDPSNLLGLPVRIILTEGIEKNGKKRQYIENYLKPASDQSVIKIDKPLTDIDSVPDIMDIDPDNLF